MTRPLTRRVAQAGRLARDAAGLPRALARALVSLLRAPAREPGLAVLSGAPLARVGQPAAYRIRAYNAGDVRRSLALGVTGWLEEDPGARFELEWAVVLDPGEAHERWVRTDWRGQAGLVSGAPAEATIWSGGEPIDRWHVEARVRDAKRAPVLHVTGSLVR